MKKFSIILIIVAILLVGYSIFPFLVFLFKAFVGIFVASLIAGGAYLGYLIGKNLSKGKI